VEEQVIPDRVVLLYHGDCTRGHWTLAEVRKCVGRYVHMNEVRRIMFVMVLDGDQEKTEGAA
jgi:hypothetical protein